MIKRLRNCRYVCNFKGVNYNLERQMKELEIVRKRKTVNKMKKKQNMGVIFKGDDHNLERQIR